MHVRELNHVCAVVHGPPRLAYLDQAVRAERREREQPVDPQHARDFGEDGIRAVEPRQQQVAEHDVDAPIGKRQCHRVGLYLTLLRQQAAFAARGLQHGPGTIDRDHAGAAKSFL